MMKNPELAKPRKNLMSSNLSPSRIFCLSQTAAVFALTIALTLALLLAPATSHALMAGAPPDSPLARVDPNTGVSPWAGVGAIKVPAGIFTGVLIDRRYVLTAAHAVAGIDAASTWFVLNLDDGGGVFLAVRAIHLHPQYRGFTLPFAWRDLALLELAAPVPSAAPVYEMAFEPPRAGEGLTFVGYGASGSGVDGQTIDANPTVKRVGRNHADKFQSAPDAKGASIFLFDFDGPGATSSMGANKFSNAEETTPATGDSGAPAFVGEGARRKVAGLITFVNDSQRSGVAKGRFGSSGGGVLLGPSKAWILKIIGRR